MIVADVIYEPVDVPPEMGRMIVEDSVPRWRGYPGLVRKYYLADPEGRRIRGIYLWETLEQAEEAYTPEWTELMTRQLGAEPEISYYRCAAVLDNRFDEVVTGA